MSTVDLKSIADGDRVQHAFLVLEREERRLANGDPYVILTLGNASGRISTAPLWVNQLEWADGAVRGKIVQAIGQINTYMRTGKRQLVVTAPLRLLPEDAAQQAEFLPRTASDVTKLWDWLDRAREEISSARLRRVLGEFFGDDDFRLQFERAPASLAGHHACVGGLLEHVVQVASIARQGARVMRADVDLVLAGALLHDIGKIEAYDVSASGFSHAPAGILLGHVVLGARMLERRIGRATPSICSESQLTELQHIVLSHHGSLEFGSPVLPATAEAELVHWADEMSAKGNDVLEALEDGEAFGAGPISDKKIWRVGRYLWRRTCAWD